MAFDFPTFSHFNLLLPSISHNYSHNSAAYLHSSFTYIFFLLPEKNFGLLLIEKFGKILFPFIFFCSLMLIFLVWFCTCFTSCRFNHATLLPSRLHHLMTHHQHLLLTSHPSHEPPWWCISAKVSKHPSYWPSRALASTSTTSTNHGRPYSTTTTSSTHGHTTTVDPTPLAVTPRALAEPNSWPKTHVYAWFCVLAFTHLYTITQTHVRPTLATQTWP